MEVSHARKETAMTGHPREHGTVVVGADGSDRGYAGVRYAAAEAARLDATLDIIHVSPGYLPVGPLLVIPDGSLQSHAAGVLERSAREATATAPDVEVATHELHGHRVDSIVRFADGAAVLVLGARHLTLADRILTGATVAGVVSRATCPTVVVPSTWEPDTPRQRVVVGFKAPRHATELLAAGFALADELDAELEILHVWKLQGVYDDMIASSVEEEQHSSRELALIEPLLADFRSAYPRVKAYVRVVHRRPAAALVGASARADRLIVAKPAHGARLHHLGGTARALLRDAQCPIEVVAVSHEHDETPDLQLERGGDLVPDGAARS
jgi:nucleotide-binding universal stress UspA family protein